MTSRENPKDLFSPPKAVEDPSKGEPTEAADISEFPNIPMTVAAPIVYGSRLIHSHGPFLRKLELKSGSFYTIVQPVPISPNFKWTLRLFKRGQWCYEVKIYGGYQDADGHICLRGYYGFESTNISSPFSKSGMEQETRSVDIERSGGIEVGHTLTIYYYIYWYGN